MMYHSHATRHPESSHRRTVGMEGSIGIGWDDGASCRAIEGPRHTIFLTHCHAPHQPTYLCFSLLRLLFIWSSRSPFNLYLSSRLCCAAVWLRRSPSPSLLIRSDIFP